MFAWNRPISAQAWQWLGFAVISFFVLLAYYPSLLHVPRADQIAYLAEVAPQPHDFKSLAIDNYDLNRKRTIAPGDQLLFRPVVYAMLGAEKYFFGYQFMWWQLVGIALHLVVIWQMLALLLCVRCGLAAVLVAGFFALLFTNMEMVIWHHINSYLVFVICILIALRHLYAILVKDLPVHISLATLFTCLLVASFTYEPANVYAGMIWLLLYLQRPKERKFLWVLLVPALLYALCSWLNMTVNHYRDFEGVIMKDAFSPLLSLGYLTITFLFWIYAGLFPTQLDMEYATRNMITEKAHLIKMLDFSNPAVWLMLVVMVLFFANIRQLLQRQWDRSLRLFLMLLIGMLLVYALIIVIGRENSRGMKNVLRVDLYYNYIFWAFFLPMCFIVMNALRWGKWQRRIMIGCIGGLVIVNGIMLYKANDVQAKGNNPIIVLVNTLEMLIKEKGMEPDFSFYVDAKYPGNYLSELRFNRNDPPGYKYSLVEILYPQYFKRVGAKYRLLALPEDKAGG